MRNRKIGLGFALCLFGLAWNEARPQGTTSPGAAKFTERMSGAAESINGLLYVAGGMSLTENVSDVGSYDPQKKSWTPQRPIPSPRSLCASTAFGNEFFILGGRYLNSVLATVEKFAPAENKWTACAPMPTARWSLMTVAAGGKIYALGGISGVGNNRRALGVVEAYDPKADRWEPVGKMPGPRQGAAIAAVDGMIYVLSGKIASYVEATANDQITERVDAFDPKTKAWSRVQDIPTGRAGARAVVAGGLVFVVGGIAKTGEFPTRIDVFNPAANKWTVGPDLPSGRSGHMCALVGDFLIVFGGSASGSTGGMPTLNGRVDAISISGFMKK
jgi:N-acetylneuraminic acid mutarotase